MARTKKSKKNVLILGANSSLAQGLIEKAKSEDFVVYGSRRNINISIQSISNSNLLELDIESKDSIANFLEAVHNLTFERIYVLIGKLSNKQPQKLDFDFMTRYLETYSTNLIYLIDRLICRLSFERPSFLVFISSRSANQPSYDVLYSASKASVSAFIRSKSALLTSNQIAVSVSSGLLIGSEMCRQMSDQFERHLSLSNGMLLTVQEFTNELWSFDFNRLTTSKHQNLSIGPEY